MVARAAFGGALDGVGLCPLRIVRFEHQRQQVRRAQNRGEHVVEIVGDPAREPADGLHFLRLAQLILEREPRRDVARDRLHANGLAVSSTICTSCPTHNSLPSLAIAGNSK